ncbi:MerR family transcriptional regulator [Streptomyces californicus]|uniref:MerR family transcriptional regulator n=1 Tax=Streptomyces californicus TaxID=67351 RepID=UPI0036827F70
MPPSFLPPRHVTIGAAAAFVGTTPRAIRHYHGIGLLPEPERGADGRRRYGYEDMVRLLWVRRMADAGIALDDIRDAFTTGRAPADTATAGTEASAGAADDESDSEGDGMAGVLERLDGALAAQEAEVRRRRAAVRRMRSEGSRTGLLSGLVTERLTGLPEGALRQADLDSLLVTERIFGPLGAAVQASRFVALATHPVLREESDRVDRAEEALDDGVAVDDPRVARVAAERYAFETALHAAVEESGLSVTDDALWDAYDDDAFGEEGGADTGSGRRPPGSLSAAEAVGLLPYDVSPARLRCMELAQELELSGTTEPRGPAGLSRTTEPGRVTAPGRAAESAGEPPTRAPSASPAP